MVKAREVLILYVDAVHHKRSMSADGPAEQDVTRGPQTHLYRVAFVHRTHISTSMVGPAYMFLIHIIILHAHAVIHKTYYHVFHAA